MDAAGDMKNRALTELKSLRDNCHKWGVESEVRKIRDYLTRAGLGLDAIGTSEEELQACFKTGHTSAAKTWLRLARERHGSQDVSGEIGNIRKLAADAGITLDEVGTTEEELQGLLSTYRPRGNWLSKTVGSGARRAKRG